MNNFIWEDIGYHAVATDIATNHVDFQVYEYLNNGEFKYKLKDKENKYTSRVEDAEVFLEGFVKWDKCSNWLFKDNQQDMMLHFCDRQTLINIGTLLGRLHDTGKFLIPNADW